MSEANVTPSASVRTQAPEFIYQADGAHEPFGYSQVVRAGQTVYVAGQVGIDPSGKIVDGFEGQARQAFANLRLALAAAGAELNDIVKVNILLTDVQDMATFRAVRDEVFQHRPASTAQVVKALVVPGLLFEIEAIAVTVDVDGQAT